MRFGKRFFYSSWVSVIAIMLTVWTGRDKLVAEINIPEYTIMIDPGHGGISRDIKDDKWDAVSASYLQYYAPGTRKGRYTEHEIAFSLTSRIKQYLDLTQSRDGWKKFLQLLQVFSEQKTFKRIKFRTLLSRKKGWKKAGLSRKNRRVNESYRLYDYPHPTKKGILAPGRISTINRHKPYLILSIHLNPASGKHPGGMGAVLAPGYSTFNLIRRISLKEKQISLFYKTKWADLWVITDKNWNRYEATRSDTWVYFHGYRTNKNKEGPWLEMFRGYRHNMISWRYKDPEGWEEEARLHKNGPYSLNHADFIPRGKFWNRERGRGEYWRRESGPVGFGGDNHYAADELLKFIQFGVRQLVPYRRKKRAMGRILKPFVSTYSLPTFTNGICAYLEVGHINRRRDRSLFLKNEKAVAISLATGIYSLFQGMKLRSGYGPYRPRGGPLNFSKYERLSGGNYFKIVTKN